MEKTIIEQTRLVIEISRFCIFLHFEVDANGTHVAMMAQSNDLTVHHIGHVVFVVAGESREIILEKLQMHQNIAFI